MLLLSVPELISCRRSFSSNDSISLSPRVISGLMEIPGLLFSLPRFDKIDDTSQERVASLELDGVFRR